MQRVVLLAIMRALRLSLSREAARELVHCLPPRSARGTLAEVLGEEWVRGMVRVVGIVIGRALRQAAEGVICLEGGQALRRALRGGRAVVVVECAGSRVFALALAGAEGEDGVAVVDDAGETVVAPDKAHAMLANDAVGFMICAC